MSHLNVGGVVIALLDKQNLIIPERDLQVSNRFFSSPNSLSHNYVVRLFVNTYNRINKLRLVIY